MTAWTDHVRNYSQSNGVSYKDAMTLARPSYNPVAGGKFSMHKAFKKVRKVGRKANNSINKAQDIVDKNAHLIDQFDKQFDTNLSHDVSRGLSKAQHGLHQGQNVLSQAEEVAGGKFKLKRAMRKARHTVGKAKSIARVAAPILSVVAPEIVLPMEAALMATGGSFKTAGGSFKTHGGRVAKAVKGGCSNCPTCGSGLVQRSQSSMVNPMHNSFNPKKPKLYKQLIHEN